MRINNIYILIFIILYTLNIYCQYNPRKNQTKISEDLYYTKIQDSVYMYTHYFPGGCNGMFIFLPNKQGLLIDTPCENTGTESLLNWIEKNFGHLKLSVIVTGFHQDNLGGDEVLLSQNIPVYSSDLTVKLVKEKGKELKNIILNSVASDKYKRYYKAYEELNLTPPNKTFSIKKGLKLKYDDEIVEVYFPGESHTIDNTVVYLHKQKILFGGCMIKGLEFNNPGFIKHANMDEWPISVKKVMNRFQDCQIVVPGHGKEDGKELLPHMIKILNDWNEKHSNYQNSE